MQCICIYIYVNGLCPIPLRVVGLYCDLMVVLVLRTSGASGHFSLCWQAAVLSQVSGIAEHLKVDLKVCYRAHSNHTPHARCFLTMATSSGQGTEHRSNRYANELEYVHAPFCR